MRSTSFLRGVTQTSTAPAPVAPLATMAAVRRRSASPIESAGAVERQAVEIIGDRDLAGRAGDAVEIEKRAGGEIGCSHFPDRFAGPVGDQNDVGRGGQRPEIGDTERQFVRNARLRELLLPRRARLERLFRQGRVKRRFDFGDAVAVVGDDAGKAPRQIDIAQEPDDAVEQEILHRCIEVELQLAVNAVVELVDGAVKRGHTEAIRTAAKAPAMAAGAAPVWSAMRTISEGPPRLIIELPSWVEMISRRRR